MHDYSIDTPIRQKLNVGIAVLALTIPTILAWLGEKVGAPKAVTFPLSFGATFALLELFFDKKGWKWIAQLIALPNLNGSWTGRGISSFKDPCTQEPYEFTINIRIKQTFTRLEVFADTEKSTSKSFMASIESQHAVPLFRYGFDNIPKNMADEDLQRHSGHMDLRITGADSMEGDYFSGKHRIRHGEIRFTRNEK